MTSERNLIPWSHHYFHFHEQREFLEEPIEKPTESI